MECNKVNVIVCGVHDVGKTSFVERYIHDKFKEEKELKEIHGFKTVNLSGQRIEVEINDSEPFNESMNNAILNKIDICLILFSIDNIDSFRAAQSYKAASFRLGKGVMKTLFIANKIDLNWAFPREYIEHCCKKLNVEWREVTCVDGNSVQHIVNDQIKLYVETKKELTVQPNKKRLHCIFH